MKSTKINKLISVNKLKLFGSLLFHSLLVRKALAFLCLFLSLVAFDSFLETQETTENFVKEEGKKKKNRTE